MKTPESKQWFKLFQAALLASAGVWLTGCSLLGFERVAKNDLTAGSMEIAAAETQAESEALDATITALGDLVNQPAEDLKPQFERFDRALDWLNDVAKRNESAANRMNRRGSDYFATWDRELATIDYGAIREQSVSRKTQVSNEFNTVNSRYRETQAVMQPLIVYLEDIRTALKNDLTAGGIASVRDIAANADKNARKVQLALAQVADELATSGARLSSIPPPTAPSTMPVGGSEMPAGESERAEGAK